MSLVNYSYYVNRGDDWNTIDVTIENKNNGIVVCNSEVLINKEQHNRFYKHLNTYNNEGQVVT